MSILRKKLPEQTTKGSEEGGLKKTLNAFDLIMLGIGAIIGVGIFVITGTVAAKYSGPAITVSFMLAGIVCIFTALAYAELSSMLPIAGGAYSYSYVVLGEVFAWLAGSCVIMINVFGASTVASGWSSYVVGVLKYLGVNLPEAFITVPAQGGIINLPAVLISLLISSVLIRGTKESALVNTLLVSVKIGAILVFVVAAIPHFDPINWENFMPNGLDGVLIGTGALFLAYSGFDAVASSAEECKNPNRDLPIGIIGSVLICAILYIIVSGLLTGIVPFYELNNSEPMAYALRKNGSNFGYALVAIGGITGMTTVMMMQLYGTSRVLFSMARDGMIPKFFNVIHPKFATPHLGIIFLGITVAIISGFLPTKTLANLASMASLGSFIFVGISVMKLRLEQPYMNRPFKCPAVFVTCTISVLSSGYLIYGLIQQEGDAFGLCVIASLLMYILYGYRNSKLNQETV
ncbi:MAG: amino acid permease [Sphingobacteriia bacterium]|nr:amino acid permease [Sphingobacteriia bacterium]